MRVILTGGGTGGHIYPAIAIADKIKEEHPEAEILFVGTERGLEKTLVPQNGYPIKFITVTGFNRKNLLKNFEVLMNLRKGLKEANNILTEFKPDIVIGTGGYVCGPIVKVAHKLKIRAFIHEQNALPGLTNKLLEKYVEKIFIGFEDAKHNFKKQHKVIVSGNPVRKDFFNFDKAECRAKLGLSENDFVVFSFGGSQGAPKINDVMLGALKTFSESEQNDAGKGENIATFFVTGKGYYDKILAEIDKENITLSEKTQVMPYVNDMATYLAACDLVVSRAGALAVTELMVCGKPAILIPSPYVVGNHQFFNAKALVDKGGAMLFEEKDLDVKRFVKTILEMKENKDVLAEMAKAAQNSLKENPVEIIYNNLNL